MKDKVKIYSIMATLGLMSLYFSITTGDWHLWVFFGLVVAFTAVLILFKEK